MNLLFVYGTLKKGCSRNRYLSDQRYLGTACTKPKYAIYQYSGYPAMIETKIGPVVGVNVFNVFGEIYEVSYDCLQQIDEIENVKEGVFKRSSVELANVNLVSLPLWQNVWNNIEGKLAIGYIFCKDLSGAKCCGKLWTPS